jgi:hypothetical protein
MRQSQPVAQIASRLGWRGAVKRHEGGANSRRRYDMGAPAVARNPRDFDVVRTTIDDFVEVMHESPVPESSVGATLQPEISLAAWSL